MARNIYMSPQFNSLANENDVRFDVITKLINLIGESNGKH